LLQSSCLSCQETGFKLLAYVLDYLIDNNVCLLEISVEITHLHILCWFVILFIETKDFAIKFIIIYITYESSSLTFHRSVNRGFGKCVQRDCKRQMQRNMRSGFLFYEHVSVSDLQHSNCS